MRDYIRLRVKEIKYETDDAVTVTFKQPFFSRIRYKSGQFITLIFNIEGKEYRRAYSLNSCPKMEDDISITAKKVNNGIISNHLFHSVKRGDNILIMKPMGSFTYEADKKLTRNIVLFGAGSGITPLMSILKSTLYFEPNSTVTLIYSNRNESSVIFKEELDLLKERFADRFFLRHIYSEKDGRLQMDELGSHLKINPFHKINSAVYYLCGPTAYMENIECGLLSLEINPENIKKESFEPVKETIAAGESQVVFKTRKNEKSIIVPSGKSLLDAGLEAKVKMRFACFNGQCGTCKCKCVTGKVKMAVDNILSESDRQEGYVLTCVGYPETENVVLEID